MVIKLSQTVKTAQTLAKTLKGGEVLALSGELGSGKTTFTQALAKALGVKATVTSPTFVLMQHYKTNKKSAGGPIWLYHLDLYRTKNFSEVKGLGLEEIWTKPQTITVIEWADKITNNLPTGSRKLKFIRDAR